MPNNKIMIWTPKTWQEFIGNNNRRQDERLRRIAIDRSLPLLLLLVGPYGCGKSVRARHIIRAYRCPHVTADGNPCHECEQCTRQGPLFNSDGIEYQQWEFDCHRIVTKTQLSPRIDDIESADKPAVFFDQFEGLSEKALRLLLTFLDNFKGIFIAAIATNDLHRLQRAVRRMPAVAPVFERIRKVYLRIPEVEEMVAFFKSKAPEWGITADEQMLRLMVTASKCSFRTCLDISQAAHENNPPVLDRATIEEFLTIEEDSTQREDAIGPNEESDPDE